MKLFKKLLLTALVIALLLPFTLLKDEEGKTLASFSRLSLPDFKMPDFKMPDFKIPDMPDMPSGKQLVPSVDGQGRQDIVYRWNDSNGSIHFTTEPPAEGIEYTLKGYDPNANVIQAVKLPDTEMPAQPIATDATDTSEQNSAPGLESPYNKDNILKLFNDSKDIQKLLNQRAEYQNSAINQ
jgi:hypothetical protein